jgi:hypothetical protein
MRSNCLPRTLGSGSSRANRSLNVATAGMLAEAYDGKGTFATLRRAVGSATPEGFIACPPHRDGTLAEGVASRNLASMNRRRLTYPLQLLGGR